MAGSGERKFHEKFPDVNNSSAGNDSSPPEHPSDILDFIEKNVIGGRSFFEGPFGRRNVIYCDFTGSGRSLQYIENYIEENVLPFYGNTHTTSNVTALQTTMYRDEARNIIRNVVGAGENDAVIFTGSGSTGSINKLIHALDLKVPPVVFVSPYEHHSNLLPWKEIGSLIVWIKYNENDGKIDVEHLISNLKKYSECDRPLIGCFTAASNITGILVDVDIVAATLHQYNALAFFDYATAGPYTKIEMNPASNSVTYPSYKDAIFLSPHKFVGGPGTPGILIAKKHCFSNDTPSNSGGGSVFYVTESSHRYLKDIEMREEGGTPAIVESIRAGLVFQLKQKITHQLIQRKDTEFLNLAYEIWKDCPNLILLGPSNSMEKLPIFSFVIKHGGSKRLLHYNFVSVILNDLFGIQARGGCACAGPYAQQLLGMCEKVALDIESLLLEDQRLDRHHLRRQKEYSSKEVLRPGFTRINLPYFYNKEKVEFILNAVKFIAEHGWKLLPMYIFNPETGEWKHKQHQIYKDRKWLGSIQFINGNMTYPSHRRDETYLTYKELIEHAENVISNKTRKEGSDQSILFGEDGERLRWFLLPSEAQVYINNDIPSSCKNFTMPFQPGVKLIDNSHTTFAEDNIKEVINLHHCNCSKLFTYTYIKNTHEFIHTKQPLEVSKENQNGISNNKINYVEEENKQKNNSDVTNTCKLVRGNSFINRTVNKVIKDDVEKDAEPIIKFHSPPKYVYNSVIEAIQEFSMIKDGDQLLLCLSGGKDSLSMLHVINQYKYYAKNKGINFKFGAVTVDPQSSGYDPSPLKEYLKNLDVPYFYEEQDIISAAAELPVCESICSFCSRMKRGRIYACARREGYNVIALGQHLDDATESFLMSTFHNGYLKSMKANYTIEAGDLRVIRPLIYTREKDLRSFADKVKLPVISENCPACFEAPKERHRMKQLLAQQEVLFPNLFKSLRSALLPLISKEKTGIENKINDVLLVTNRTDGD